MLRVWVDGRSVGVLDRFGSRGSTFVYDQGTDPRDAVSLTMPPRTASWDVPYGLHPIFDMNLPEGALRERLRRRFAKAAGTFDEFDLLSIVGRSQIGRVRFTGFNEDLDEYVPFQSVDELLRARRDGDLFDHLIEIFEVHSGLAGVQPKIMIRGQDGDEDETRQSQSFKGATHIVKFWDPNEYPDLAANEFFCLSAARHMGLETPRFNLSDDGSALVVERFDLTDNGYLGFEDFCVLNALQTNEKYKGGYESRLFKRVKEFVSPFDAARSLQEAFKLFVLNCAVRNGDAHLKNWGVTYTDAAGEVKLAPGYDVVTTCAYLPADQMALTVGGTTRWPDAKVLMHLGRTRADLPMREVSRIFEQAADALSDAAFEAEAWFRDNATSADTWPRMQAAWEDGIRSLGFGERTLMTPIRRSPRSCGQI